MKTSSNQIKLDSEWIALIIKAKTMGYTPNDIRIFFKKISK